MTVDSGYYGTQFRSYSVPPVQMDRWLPIMSWAILHGFVAIMFNDVNFAQAYGNTITGSGSGIEVAATTRSVSGAQIYNNADL